MTQVIPLHYVTAAEMSRTLASLLPEKASLIATGEGNALILTDTLTSIHRMLEIVQPLDTAVPGQISIEVFRLTSADAKALAAVVKDLFAPQDSDRNNAKNTQQYTSDPNAPNTPASGSPSATTDGNPSAGSALTMTTLAVAEEQSNSLLVRTSPGLLPIIRKLVKQLDVKVQDLAEVRVFHLRNADADETADLLSTLFSPAKSIDTSGARNLPQFAQGPGGPEADAQFGSINSGTERGLRLQSAVMVVGDARTSSVVVIAGSGMMAQIGPVIADLDSSENMKQRVYVFNAQNTDAAAVEQLLAGFFPASGSAGSAARNSTSQQNAPGNQLSNRASQRQNQTANRTTSGMNNSSGRAGAGQ